MNAKVKESKTDQILSSIRALTGRLDRLERRLLREGEPNDLQSSAPQENATKSKPKSKLHTKILLSIPLRFLFGSGPRTVVTILSAVLTGVTGYIALRYDVSAVPFTALDTSNPEKSHFLITNEGPFAIHNVFYACNYVPPRSSNGRFIAYSYLVPYPIPSLHNHGYFSALCVYPPSAPRPIKEGTFLDMEVTYTPSLVFWQTREGGELFMLKFNENGNHAWIPVQDMTPKANDLKKFTCPTCSN